MAKIPVVFPYMNVLDSIINEIDGVVVSDINIPEYSCAHTLIDRRPDFWISVDSVDRYPKLCMSLEESELSTFIILSSEGTMVPAPISMTIDEEGRPVHTIIE